jgi:hypothetical protein
MTCLTLVRESSRTDLPDGKSIAANRTELQFTP